MSNNLKKIIISNVTENNEFYDTNKDSFENNPNNDMVTDTANDMTNELSEKSMDDINKICFVDENKKQSNEMLEKNNEEQELYNIDNDSIDNDSTILTKELDIVDIDDIIDEEDIQTNDGSEFNKMLEEDDINIIESDSGDDEDMVGGGEIIDSTRLKLSDISEIKLWDIIDIYFRDTKYYKSQHQLNSYNEFIRSKTNGIQSIILDDDKPLILYKEPLNSDSTKFKYEIKVYFGKKVDESGKLISDTKDNIFISTPTIYNGETNTFEYMYPNNARLKGLTYASNVFCNICIVYNILDEGKTVTKFFEKVNIGKIPIMLHSSSCLLNGLDKIKLRKMGECQYDQGGYFIVNGKEKVILSQETKVNDIMYIYDSYEPNVDIQAIIKSVSKQGFQSSRRNEIKLVNTNISTGFSQSNIQKRLIIRILDINIKIPIFILLRALNDTNDKNIFDKIIYENDDIDLKKKLNDLLAFSQKECKTITTQKQAYKYLAIHTKGKDTINVIDILNNNLLPNYGSDNDTKLNVITYTIRKLLLTHLNIYKKIDRDSYTYKRINTPGLLLTELYRELFHKFKKTLELEIDKEYKFNFDKQNGLIENIVNSSNKNVIFDSKIMNSIEKSFGSVFGTGISAQQGIVQDLNRNCMLGTLSHIRRIVTQLPPGSKAIGPRKLHNSQWGFICPTESPDGGNTGIINHLTIISDITSNKSEKNILTALLDLNLELIENIVNIDLINTVKVFINGKWVGLHREPQILLKILKLMKINGIIHIHTSISWNIKTNEFHIFTDAGRVIRPIFCLDKGYNKLINDNFNIEEWNQAIFGYMYEILKDDIDINSDIYYRDIFLKLKKENKLDILKENASSIEYIDSKESESAYISKDVYGINSEHTHSEIHNSLILSPLALHVPFPDHSQYPRNVFSCQQTKQAVGIYSTQYNTRFDTFGHILNYPQKPIVTSKFQKYIDIDKMPYGINAIVAIASYTGYNQEDSVILNKSSVDRGMFRSLYLRSYESNESEGKQEKTKFSNPNNLKNTTNYKNENIDNIDDNGIVRENTFITHEDVMVSKVTTITQPNGIPTNRVTFDKINYGASGYVDKVIITKNKDNTRKCRVRIRKEKIAGIGDKFASRTGQKGMCGMVLEQKDMPFTPEGIVPDIIINPHAFPSRMTINYFIEMILGKTACVNGYQGDSTPFQNNSIFDYIKLLESSGYERHGEEIMYNGINGEQIKTSIFFGPCYYQRLKIMVADKIHSRSTGPLQSFIRQPSAGRANQGGLRIGEMERDGLICHGASNFLRESTMERSDKFNVQINKNNGLISYSNENNARSNIYMPYAMKMLLQELETLSIAPRLVVDSNISNESINEYNKLNINPDKTNYNENILNIINEIDENEMKTETIKSYELDEPDSNEMLDIDEIKEELDIEEGVDYESEIESDILEQSINLEDEDQLNKITDIDKYQKINDIYDKGEEEDCEKNISWKLLDKMKTSKQYTEYLKQIQTNPKYIQFNQIYFHAGDEIQFEKYGYIQSRILSYPKNPINMDTIYSGYNSETTYNTFKYIFEKLKKGIYVVIRDNKLSVFLPFSNINYVNNWKEVLQKSTNPVEVRKIKEQKNVLKIDGKKVVENKNVADPVNWYANNCIFRPEKMRFDFSKFILEGDKTVVPMKQFLINFMDKINKDKKIIPDVDFFINPRDFPILKKNHLEPYEQIFSKKKIEEKYIHEVYTPILSQSGNKNFNDIPIPTEDDIKRIMSDKIFQQNDGCGNNYNNDLDITTDWDQKGKNEYKNICVFRGSATGCGTTPNTNMRIKAAVMSNKLKEKGINILDAKLTGWNRKPKIYQGKISTIDTSKAKFTVDKKKNFMNLEEQSKYKYILNIDGHVKAFRLSNELRMGSVILLVDSPYTLWFQDKLVEYEHYVPVSEDLSDLETQIRWCIDNDDTCEKIAKNAMDFYNTYLDKDGMFNYFETLLNNLSNMRVPPTFNKSKNNVSVIVAYRDSGDGIRKQQLNVFITQMIKILSSRVDRYYINIIEQESDREDYEELPELIKQEGSNMAKFNLGRLKNIGFHISNLETQEIDNVHFILSDLDLIPSHPLIPDYIRKPDNPIHLANRGTRYTNNKGESLNKAFFGGVISVNETDFIKANGYPNDFWGWGGEDEALKERFIKNKIKIDKSIEPVVDLEEFVDFDGKNNFLKQNKLKDNRKKEKIIRDNIEWKNNGLNNIESTYKIISEKNYTDGDITYDNIGHVKVKLIITEQDKQEIKDMLK